MPRKNAPRKQLRISTTATAHEHDSFIPRRGITSFLVDAVVSHSHGGLVVRLRSMTEPQLTFLIIFLVSSERRCRLHPPPPPLPATILPSPPMPPFTVYTRANQSRQAMSTQQASHTHDASPSPQASPIHGGDAHGWRSVHSAGATVRGDGEGGGRAGGRGGASGEGQLARAGTRRKSLTQERYVGPSLTQRIGDYYSQLFATYG